MPRPQFALTGVIAGGIGGLVVSVILEIAMGRPRQIIMMVANVIGLTLGTVVEGIRYAWGVWRWKVAKKRQQTPAPKP